MYSLASGYSSDEEGVPLEEMTHTQTMIYSKRRRIAAAHNISADEGDSDSDSEDEALVQKNLTRLGESMRSQRILGKVTYVENEATTHTTTKKQYQGLLYYHNINFGKIRLTSDPWKYNVKLVEKLMHNKLHSKLKTLTDVLQDLCMDVQVHGKPVPTLDTIQLLLSEHECKEGETQRFEDDVRAIEYRMKTGIRLAVVARGRRWTGYVILPE